MEMGAGYYGYDLPISTYFWGMLIFVAVVASLILAGRALERLRNRKRLDGEAVVERGHTKGVPTKTLAEERGITKDPLTETLAELRRADHRTGTPGTTPHDTNELSLIGKQRKAIKERRKRI